MWRIIDTMQEFIDRQTGVRSIMCEIAADTAADLPTNTADRVFILGSFATAIDTGDIYKINSAGAWILQPSQNAWQNVYTKPEIDSMITEIYGIIAYYHTTLISDTGEITFYSLGGNVGTWTIYGNGQQTGTPSTDNPIQPDFVGTLDGAEWTIPLTCAGQTTPVYLGQVSTVRRVRKLVLTGNEAWIEWKGNYYSNVIDSTAISNSYLFCTHFINDNTTGMNIGVAASRLKIASAAAPFVTSVTDLKAWLADQYAAGTPVTVWYVLATPETTITNEPLCKIGDYADELHSEDAGVTIPTIKGSNTLTVDTELKPSRIEIQG